MLCFVLSPNIYWAIAMLFAYLITERFPQIHRKMYVSKTAGSFGLDAETVQSNYYTVETGLYAIQPTVLSAFVTLGMNLACSAAGTFCGFLFSIFAKYNNKRQRNTCGMD